MVNGCWAIGHRWLYMHPVGPKPNAQELHHEREKPRCVRPGHLRPLVPAGHRYVTALVNWMFTIAPNGKLAIDNVTRSQRERRYAETYRLPSDKALAVEGVASHHKKLPNCPSREALGRPIPSVRWGGKVPPARSRRLLRITVTMKDQQAGMRRIGCESSRGEPGRLMESSSKKKVMWPMCAAYAKKLDATYCMRTR